MLNLLRPRADRDPPPNAKLFLSVTHNVAPSVAPPRAFTFNFGNLLVRVPLPRGVDGKLLILSSKAGPVDAKLIAFCCGMLFALVRGMMPDSPKSSSIAVSVVLCGLQRPSSAAPSNILPGMPMRLIECTTVVRFMGGLERPFDDTKFSLPRSKGCPLALHELAVSVAERPE